MSFEKVKRFFGEEVHQDPTSPQSQRSSMDFLLPIPKPMNLQVSIEELPEHQSDIIYSTSLQTSKKLKNFFGEEDLAVVGVGSTKKLGEFYGVPIKSLKRHPSAETLSPEKEEFPAEFKIEPHDVSVHQIQGTGLKSMIISVFPLFYFIAFLLQEQTVENCLFVLDVLELEKLEDAEWKSKAKELYHTYFTSQGMLELNLTHKSKAGVEEAIEMLDKQCLNQAFSEIMVLLEQSYSGFKKSDLFNRMAYDLGDYRVIRTKGDVHRTATMFHSYAPTLLDERTVFLTNSVQHLINHRMTQFALGNL